MIDHVDPAGLANWHPTPEAAGAITVLDVREPAELAVASVKPDGFTLLTIPMGEIPARLAELDPDQPIACLCHHGARSMRVAQFLVQNGFAHVANISGGIDAWSQQRDPSVPRY
ncbi:rhodanese-like domain-containing protein [Pseudorhodoferax sp. Leaf267]|uniref:rhodanese-like domain-containing protein n=1 Tax=Pseudorhodoferax sp. Leaf267 TaxID=1736316 RepID=UPI0006F3BF96|nr:rhodanese-like domain-containing protein [Pseudorhodoferax sp. Leaf267]KQP19779.1 sulfurtransferase [Pseudorhodoferax sp. Leaf267]